MRWKEKKAGKRAGSGNGDTRKGKEGNGAHCDRQPSYSSAETLFFPACTWTSATVLDSDEWLGDGGCGRGRLLPHLQPAHLGRQRRERGQVDAAARSDDAAQHSRHQDAEWDSDWPRVHQLHDAGQSRPTRLALSSLSAVTAGLAIMHTQSITRWKVLWEITNPAKAIAELFDSYVTLPYRSRIWFSYCIFRSCQT